MSKWVRQVSPLTPEHGGPVKLKPGAMHLRNTRDIDHVISAACADCNGRFFNELQAACEPYLRAAVFGEEMVLDTAAKQHMASWAYKTSLLLALLRRPRSDWGIVAGAKCREFYLTRRPELGARVWLGSYDLSSNWPELINRVDRGVAEAVVAADGTRITGNAVMLTVGYLLLLTVYWDSPLHGAFGNEDERFPRSHFIPLWPIDVRDSVWPPARYAYEDLDRLTTWDEVSAGASK